MRDALRHALDIRDEIARRISEPIFAEGFDAAADICRAELEEQLHPLRERLAAAELDGDGQRLLAALEAFRAALEQSLVERSRLR